jgi:hypothetical protein
VISTTGGNISGPISPAASAFTLFLTGTPGVALSTNTLYSIGSIWEYDADGSAAQAATQDGSQLSPLSTLSAYTAAAQPSGTTLFGSGAVLNSVTLQWNANGNALGTTYQVDYSTGGTFFQVFSTQSVAAPNTVAGASVTATLNNLPGGNTIIFMVQALNAFSVGSGYDIAVSTVIPVITNQPVFNTTSTFALGISSIVWSWTAVAPSAVATTYTLFNAAGGAVSPLGQSATYFIQTALAINTSYQNYVVAYGQDGFGNVISTASPPLTLFTLANATTGLTLIKLSSVTESVTAYWGANNNPAGTVYYLMWWGVNTTTVTYVSTSTILQVTNLFGGSTIYYTVQAQNGNGILTSFDATYFTVNFPSTTFPVSFQTLPPTFTGIVTFLMPSGPFSINIASGSFLTNVTITMQTPPANTVPGATGSLTPLPNPVYIQVTAADAFGSLKEPLFPVAMRVGYGNVNLAGTNPNNLTLVYFDTIHQQWVPLPTQRDVAGQALQGISDHLSLFSIMGLAPGTSLSYITVGPNPLRPAVNPGQVMTFRNMPAEARVQIFTYIGEKVAEFTADDSGLATWDGRNRSGNFVASGIYLALIEGAGTKKTLRLAIER